MDDPDVYGPVVYRKELSEAIFEGLVCDYRIVMVVVEHLGLQHQLRRTRNATFQDTAALISLSTALLKPAARYPGTTGAGKWISFHQRVKDVQAFTDTFLETAAALTGETIPGPTAGTGQDAEEVPLVPAMVRADTVHMDHPDRVALLDNLTGPQPLTGDGRPSHLTLVANCRPGPGRTCAGSSRAPRPRRRRRLSSRSRPARLRRSAARQVGEPVVGQVAGGHDGLDPLGRDR
ncbi:hypothetical protein [Streptomyces sp. NPDC055632]